MPPTTGTTEAPAPTIIPAGVTAPVRCHISYYTGLGLGAQTFLGGQLPPISTEIEILCTAYTGTASAASKMIPV